MMLEDARPSLLITSEDQLARFSDIPGLESLCYQQPLAAGDDAPLALSKPDHTAYIIFTSGSTGRPKGVMVGQTAIVNRLLWMQDRYPLSADDVVAQKTPCSFDVSVWEFWWPFIAGSQLVMAEPERAPRPAGDAAVLRPLRRDHHPLCAVDAGGVCRLAGCGQRGRLPHAAAGILQRRSAADGIVPRVGALNRRAAA